MDEIPEVTQIPEMTELSALLTNMTLFTLVAYHLYVKVWDFRLGPKVGQICIKWNKSGTFSDQILVHFRSVGKKN